MKNLSCPICHEPLPWHGLAQYQICGRDMAQFLGEKVVDCRELKAENLRLKAQLEEHDAMLSCSDEAQRVREIAANPILVGPSVLNPGLIGTGWEQVLPTALRRMRAAQTRTRQRIQARRSIGT